MTRAGELVLLISIVTLAQYSVAVLTWPIPENVTKLLIPHAPINTHQQSQPITSHPTETTPRQTETASQIIQTTVQPIEPSSQLMNYTHQPKEPTSMLTETVAGLIEASPQITETIHQAIESTDQLIKSETAPQIIENVHEPTETMGHLIETTYQPFQTTYHHSESTVQPTETAPQLTETGVQENETAPQLIETSSEFIEVFEGTPQLIETTHQPFEITDRLIEYTVHYTDAAPKFTENTIQPTEISPQLIKTTHQSNETTHQVMETSVQLTETTSKLIENTVQLPEITPHFTEMTPQHSGTRHFSVLSVLSDKVTVSGRVLTTDDAPPCTKGFQEWMYHSQVQENHEYDVLPMVSHIRTCGNRSGVVYSMMISKDLAEYRDTFWINNKTGEIHMEGTLDYEKIQRIDLILKVSNADGTDEGSSFVFVDIIDVNDNAPVMSDSVYNVSVNEDAPVGTFLITLSATDKDSGNNSALSYFLDTPPKPDDCPLTVTKKGEVMLKNFLDYEAKHQYTCSVYAEETSTKQHQKSNISQVIINVNDVNDNSPVFTHAVYNFTMSWPLENGDYVGKVTAFDKDSGKLGSVTNSVESPYNTYLHVNQTTGEITVLDGTAFAFSTAGTVKFVVIAHDGGSPSRLGETEVRIKMVKGYQRWFFFQTSYNFTVMEDAPNNMEVGRVEVNSSDVTYMLSPGYTGLPFTVASSGVINVNSPSDLDYESNKTYFFTVQADDNFTKVVVNVTINVGDVNDNTPVFVIPNTDPFTVYIDRLAAKEELIFQVHATDKDSGENGNVTYSIPSDFEAKTFAVSRTNGKIYLRRSAVSIDEEQLHLTVQATDHGTRPNKRDVELTIIKIKTSPYEEYLYVETEENENVHVNSTSLLGRFEALKRDLVFDIDAGNRGEHFSLSGNVNLTSNNKLDYETHQYWDLRINVTGKSNRLLVGYIHVAIKVLDMNDNAPIFLTPKATNFSIPLNAQTNVPIYRFVAHDKDSMRNDNGAVMYSMVGGDENRFHIDKATGDLTLKKTMNVTGIFTVMAMASDPKNNATAPQMVTFTFFDPNLGYPKFDKLAYFGSVPENYPANSRVLSTEATLSQFPFEHDVTIDVVGNNMEFYTLSPYGDLHTNEILDREVQSQYPLAVQATGGHRTRAAPKITTVFALINVNDVNDESPYFPFSVNRTTVSLEAPSNVSVATIEAVDKDSDAKLTYSINAGDVKNSFTFHPKGNTAELIVRQPQTLEPNKTYNLTLFVEDGLPNEHNDTTQLLLTVV